MDYKVSMAEATKVGTGKRIIDLGPISSLKNSIYVPTPDNEVYVDTKFLTILTSFGIMVFNTDTKATPKIEVEFLAAYTNDENNIDLPIKIRKVKEKYVIING